MTALGTSGCDGLCDSFFYSHDGTADGNVIIRRVAPTRDLIGYFSSVAEATSQSEPSASSCDREEGEFHNYEIFIDVDRDCPESSAASCPVESGDPFTTLELDEIDISDPDGVSFRGFLTSDSQRAP
ncbi:MAG: hypothetical protein AAF851_22605 [Myxococcota bacterium]